MNNEWVVYWFLGGWILGIGIGYIMWAPLSQFKRAFIDGMTLKFLWGKSHE